MLKKNIAHVLVLYLSWTMPLVLRLHTQHSHQTWLCYGVYNGGMCCGMMRQRPHDPYKGEWEWFFNAVPLDGTRIKSSGTAATLEKAKVEFRRNWECWLEWAALCERRA